MTETHTCFECNGAGYFGRLDWGMTCSACHGNGYIFSERAPKSATHVSSMHGTGASGEGDGVGQPRTPSPQ
jgi:DnaJ-class molecular chaperone